MLQFFKKIFTVLFLFSVIIVKYEAKNHFYKMTDPNGNEHYIFGTMHSDDNEITNLSKNIYDAIGKSDIFLMETGAISNPNILFAEGDLYDQYLSEGELELLKKLSDFHVIDYERVMHMKPWVVAIIFSSPVQNTPFNQDRVLKDIADSKMKITQGLMDANEHFSSLDYLTYQQQFSFLKKILNMPDEEKQKDYKKLLNAYQHNTLEEVLKVDIAITEKMFPKDIWPGVKEKILDSRNKLFAMRIEELIQGNRLFVAVGASHLSGPTGLINSLSKKNYIFIKLD